MFLGGWLAHKTDVQKVIYAGRLVLRFLLGLSLFYGIYYAVWYKAIPDIHLIAQYDAPFKEISARDLQRLFFDKAPSTKYFFTAYSIAVLALLTMRKTAGLGFLLLIPFYGFQLLTNIDESCALFSAKAHLWIAGIALLPEWKNWSAYWLRQETIRPESHPFFRRGHAYDCLTLGKYFLWIGAMVFLINRPQKHYGYYAENALSPIKGVWTIKDVDLQINSDKDYQSDTLYRAQKIYLSSSRYGKIRMNDTLTTFEYMVDPSNNQFEMYNFYEFRKLDLKGRFEIISADTIRFKGRNAKDEVSFVMVLEEGIPVE